MSDVDNLGSDDAAREDEFDVNDFDEAYLGHYTWDLQRMAAGVSLLGADEQGSRTT